MCNLCNISPTGKCPMCDHLIYEGEEKCVICNCDLTANKAIYQQKENKAPIKNIEVSKWVCQSCGKWELKGTQVALYGKCYKCLRENVGIFPGND